MAERNPAPTKLSRPRLASVYTRTRLFHALDEAARRPVAWISAPAGAGKTTLAASWLEARGRPVLWYRIDVRDAEPATFFYYLREAARRIAPRRRTSLPLLTPEYALGIPVYARNFFERLGACVPASTVLVFDDYQDLPPDTPLARLLPEALAMLPDTVQVFILSRSDPPPAFAALRARRRLALLDESTLQLTPAETGEMARLQRPLSVEEAELLHAQTQGWMAGVVLMLEHAANDMPLAAVPDARAQEAIFDYFSAELLARLPPDHQDLLLKTALLPQIGVPAAEALAGVAAARYLAELARQNYFTQRLAGNSRHYQYHPLFRRFLLAQAELRYPAAELRALRQRAAQLLQTQGATEAAVELLRVAEDWPAMSELVMQAAPALLAQGRGAEVATWIESLPIEATESRPWLSYWWGASFLPMNTRAALPRLERSLRQFEAVDDPVGSFLAWAALAEALLLEYLHVGTAQTASSSDASAVAPDGFVRLDAHIALLDQLLERHRTFPTPEIEGAAVLQLLIALIWRQPGNPALHHWAERATALWESIPDVILRLRLGVGLCHYHIFFGQSLAAERLMHANEQLAGNCEALPLATLFNCGMGGYVHAFFDDAERSLKAVREGLRVADACGIRLLDGFLLGAGLYGALSSGALDEADAMLDRLGRNLAPLTPNLDAVHYHLIRSWRERLADDPVRAADYARTALEISERIGAVYSGHLARHGLAVALLEQGRLEEATMQAAQVHAAGQALHSPWLVYLGNLLEAELEFAGGRPEAALGRLAQALRIQREAGYGNPRLWTSTSVASLYVKALEHGIEIRHVRRLASRRAIVPREAPLHLENWPWPVRIHTLGAVSVWVNDQPLAFSGKAQSRPLQLLLTLVGHGAREVSEALLTEALWPDLGGDAAHEACAIALHRLRRLLGHAGAVVQQNHRFSLDPRLVWIDAWAFEHLLEMTRSGGNERYRHRALALYRGPFLGHDPAVPRSARFAERLRAKHLEACLAGGSALELAGKLERAAALYLAGIEADERAEALYLQLMRCLETGERHAEALAIYQRCRGALAVLDLQPCAEIEALHRRLREQPDRRAAASPN